MARRFVFIRSAAGGGSSYDSDAQAYFTAAGITDTAQKDAYNSFVLTGKADGWYSKMIALYPLLGGSSSSHAVNAKNPGTYNLTFVGSPTHNTDGIQWDGSTQYAQTGIIATALTSTNHSLGMYSRTAGGSGVNQYFDMGAGDTSGANYSLFTWRISPDNAAGYDGGSENTDRLNWSHGNNGAGFYVGTTESGTQRIFKNGTLIASRAHSGIGSMLVGELYVGAWKFCYSGTNTLNAIFYSIRQSSFYFFGSGLTSTEAASLTTAMDALQLCRYDTDAIAYFTAAGITDPAQKVAYSNFVISAKANGYYSKFIALYPMIGGVDISHYINAKNPSTYGLTFSGSMTHSSTGVTFNGSSQWADTGIVSSSVLSLLDKHVMAYSGSSGGTGGGLIGNNNASNSSYDGIFPNVGGSCYPYLSDLNSVTVTNTDSSGFFMVSRTNSTHFDVMIRSTITNVASAATSLQNNSQLELGRGNSQYLAYECRFASVGYGMTTTEMANFRADMETLQTALGRNVI
jgi:hypothetical protein